MFKEILFGQNSREKILKGVSTLNKAVSSTLGPRGQNVSIEEGSSPTITKDGVTVARQIFLKDKFENMGVMLAQKAAEDTNREAGDGTTSTITLLNAILTEGHKAVAAGMNPILIKRGMDAALKKVVKLLKKQSKEIKTAEEKKQIATISANNDSEIGELVSKVIEKTGIDGVVTIINSNSIETEVEYVEGTKLNSGLLVPIFMNNRKNLSVEMNKPEIIITSDDIVLNGHIINLLEKRVSEGQRDFVLLANKIEGEALGFLIKNQLQGIFRCVPINLPSFGNYQKDLMHDLASLTGATVLGKEEGVTIDQAEKEHLGMAESVISGRDFTIISGAKGDIKKRIVEVKALLEKEKDSFKKEKLKDRLGRLTGSVANIKAGGANKAEQDELRYRIEDALNATKSAIQEGIIEGGGLALLRCQSEIFSSVEPDKKGASKEFGVGFDIVAKSLEMPFRQIVDNGGKSGEAVLGEIMARKDEGIGYNALTGEYEDLFKAGIIDPRKVVRNEITNAVATAGIILTCGCSITTNLEEEKK